MRRDKDAAIRLRQSGKSYNEIYAALKIPKATLSDWFSKIDWSDKVREKLVRSAAANSTIRLRALDKIRGSHLQRVYDEARREARLELKILKYNPLFISGMMIYWGEGDKVTKHATRIANVDPGTIDLFITFLIRVCEIPRQKIRAYVLIYPDLNASACVNYWSEKSRLPIENFSKPVTIQGKHKTKRLSFGVCNISVSSTYFKVKIMEWLRLLPAELKSKAYYANM